LSMIRLKMVLAGMGIFSRKVRFWSGSQGANCLISAF
jgi:hypothetical protein